MVLEGREAVLLDPLESEFQQGFSPLAIVYLPHYSVDTLSPIFLGPSPPVPGGGAALHIYIGGRAGRV